MSSDRSNNCFRADTGIRTTDAPFSTAYARFQLAGGVPAKLPVAVARVGRGSGRWPVDSRAPVA
jgi:hypothetical protein